MIPDTPTDRLITGTNIQEFFQDSVTEALTHQEIRAREDTICYVVNLLTAFTRSEDLYEMTPDGLMLRPLAELYGAALEAPTTEVRHQALRRLGDIALFIAGLYSSSLNRKLVDVDYYVAMGGSAYAYLSDASWASRRSRALAEIFDELATKFQSFVDVLSEVGERTQVKRDVDIMRLYELWTRTGSKRIEKQLKALGIHPISARGGRLRH